MGSRKPNSRDHQSRSSEQPRDVAEARPNPQGQQKILKMPLRPDQRRVTSRNIAQNPSTVENRMNPSVATSAERNTAPDTDSMFNNADPQTRELVEQNNARNRSRLRSKKRKTA
jgi:pyridoxine 5'-phosphate synthase PdxJ